MDFICPSPLVYAYEDKDTTIWAFEAGNCAVPCPSIQITESEFELQAQVFTYVVLFTTLITLIILFKVAQRFFIRSMFMAGFFLFATVALVFVYLNRNNDVVCSGDGHYVKRSPLCVFQAAVFVFSIIWVQAWSVILALDAYLHIINSISLQHDKWRKKVYFSSALGLSLICTLIPMAANNLGFDPYANIPFCLYLFSDEKAYFWGTLFVPFVVLNVCCSCVTIAGAIKIQTVLVLSKSPLENEVFSGTGSQFGGDSRQSSEDFQSGHVDYASSFGGSVGGQGNPDTVRSALHGSPNKTSDSDAFFDDRKNHVDSPINLNEPLLQDFDDSVLVDEGIERDSSGSNLNRYETPIDPACLTNVTEAPTTKNSENKSSSGSGDIHGDGILLRNNGARISPENTFDDENYQSLRWLRFWSFNGTRSSNPRSPSMANRKISHMEYLIRKTIKYNGRTILFLVMFCLTTLFVAPILIQLQQVKYNYYDESADNFVECLLKASVTCETRTQSGVDSCAEEACGQHPAHRPSTVEMMTIIVWIAGYGIIPGLVFGTYS